MKTSLKSFLNDARQSVEKTLDSFVPKAAIEPQILHEAVRWSLFAGGKRFRPALCLAVGATFAAEKENLLKTAAALEMIHTYSLIHDDLPAMDNDDLRRGQPTCHKKFDEATAILAGDVLQTLAFQIVSEDVLLPPEVRLKVLSELARAAGTPSGMVAGQIFDLQAEGKSVSAAQLEKIHRAKTGAMIVAAARAGAIVGAASEKELEYVSVYATQLGLLFQIVDDLLDVSGTTQNLGKTPGKDLQNQKATYPALYGYAKAQELAVLTHQKACAALAEIEKPTALLREIADYILNRNS
jgi:geranylgeranyl diphosphate synthase type II